MSVSVQVYLLFCVCFPELSIIAHLNNLVEKFVGTTWQQRTFSKIQILAH